MDSHNLPSIVATLSELRVSGDTTEAEAAAAMRVLASNFNDCLVGTIRFSGQTPWERHPGDELLYVVHGAVEVIVLLDDGAHETTVSEGSIFIVPADRWHRQRPKPTVSLMFVTPAQGTDASWSEDPRVDAQGDHAS
jgi:mannose-6-phosphate isomerase-like protein (cupin superfamily)